MTLFLERLNRVPPGLFVSIAIVLTAAGYSLFDLFNSKLTRIDQFPVSVPFTIIKGNTVAAHFTAEIDEPYELEFGFSGSSNEPLMLNTVLIRHQDSVLNIKWQIINRDHVILQGDSRDFLYTLPGGGYCARGVASITARKGERYDIRAEVKVSHEQLSHENPRLNVRLNRWYWGRYYNQIRSIRRMAKVFMLSAMLCVILEWVKLLWTRKKKKRQ